MRLPLSGRHFAFFATITLSFFAHPVTCPAGWDCFNNLHKQAIIDAISVAPPDLRASIEPYTDKMLSEVDEIYRVPSFFKMTYGYYHDSIAEVAGEHDSKRYENLARMMAGITIYVFDAYCPLVRNNYCDERAVLKQATVIYDGFQPAPDYSRIKSFVEKKNPTDISGQVELMVPFYNRLVNGISNLWVTLWKEAGRDISGLPKTNTLVRGAEKITVAKREEVAKVPGAQTNPEPARIYANEDFRLKDDTDTSEGKKQELNQPAHESKKEIEEKIIKKGPPLGVQTNPEPARIYANKDFRLKDDTRTSKGRKQKVNQPAHESKKEIEEKIIKKGPPLGEGTQTESLNKGISGEPIINENLESKTMQNQSETKNKENIITARYLFPILMVAGTVLVILVIWAYWVRRKRRAEKIRNNLANIEVFAAIIIGIFLLFLLTKLLPERPESFSSGSSGSPSSGPSYSSSEVERTRKELEREEMRRKIDDMLPTLAVGCSQGNDEACRTYEKLKYSRP